MSNIHNIREKMDAEIEELQIKKGRYEALLATSKVFGAISLIPMAGIFVTDPPSVLFFLFCGLMTLLSCIAGAIRIYAKYKFGQMVFVTYLVTQSILTILLIGIWTVLIYFIFMN
ncbi:MAG: hypothetical protein R3211_09445 [Balneolaceae bacterium]|nr:hypothetical protein [Balneolaceae bacterium]